MLLKALVTTLLTAAVITTLGLGMDTSIAEADL